MLAGAVAIAMVMLTGAAAWHWHCGPAWQALRREEARTAALHHAMLQAGAAAAELASLRQRDEAVRRRVAELEREWQPYPVQALLLALPGAASASVAVESLRPLGMGASGSGAPVGLAMQLAGRFPAIVQWIARVPTLPGVTAIDRFELASTGADGMARLSVRLQAYLDGAPVGSMVPPLPAAWARLGAPAAGPIPDLLAGDRQRAAERRSLPGEIAVEALQLHGTIRSGRDAAALLSAQGELFLARAGQQLDRQGTRLCRIEARQVELCVPEGHAGRRGSASRVTRQQGPA